MPKTCTICGIDCSDRPRVKDAKGRYACRECLEKQARSKRTAQGAPAAKPAPKRPANVDPVMIDILDDVPDPAKANCPSCGARMQSADAVLCTRCGFNRAEGKAVRTRVQRAENEKKTKGASGGAGFELTPLKVLAIGLIGAVGLGIFAAFVPAMSEAVFWIALIWVGVSNIAMIGAAFNDGDTMWGILGLLQGVPILGLAFPLYYCTLGSDRTTWKINFWMAHLGAVIVLFAFAIGIFMGTVQPSGFALDFLEIDESEVGEFATGSLDLTGYADMTDDERMDALLVVIADEILYDRLDRGEDLSDEEMEALDFGETQDDYPADVWQAARDRWDSLSESERRDYRDSAFSFYSDYDPDAPAGESAQDQPAEP